MKKFLFIATLLCSWLSFSPMYAQDVVEIGSVEQLKAFRDAVNGGNQYAGKTVNLTADLDLSSETNWTPIGNLVAYPTQSFNGTFDGNGHSISNVTVNDNTPNHAVAGLFGSVVNGTIKNLTVKNVNLTSTHYAGGIVAYTSNAPTIENCHVIGGTIKSTPEIVNGSYDNGDKIGGIMGYATAGSTITNCSVENVTLSAYRDLGGIVGFSAGTVTNNTVTNVTVTQDLTNGYKNPTPTTIGDIIGRDGGATLSGNEVIESNPVAQIGDVKYETIAEAIAAATAGQTVKVLVAGTYTLPNIPNNITLEGDVDDVVFNHTTAGSIASVPNGATFKNVTFNFGNVNYHGFQHAGTINMEGCTLNGKLFSYGNMNFTTCQFVQSNSDYHMWTYSGNVTYTGCTFTNNATGKFLNVYNESGATRYIVTVDGCTFINNASANKAALNVKATSGSNLLAYDVIVNNCTTQGAFPAASSSDALVVLNELIQVDDRPASGEDNITVTQDGAVAYPVAAPVAQIGSSKYETLEAAFAAAQDGETITLLADCAGNGIVVPQGKFTTGLTVDFGGFTYTVDGATVGSTGTQTQAFQLLKDNKITFQDGTIYSEKAKILVQNYSDLTLEGMTLTMNNENYTSAYTLSNNNGNVVIDGTTINANPAGGFAFDVCRYSSYPSVSVTVQGESVINGDIEIYASGSNAKDGFGLALNGGTLTGNIVLDATAIAAMEATPEKVSITKADAFGVAAPEGYKWVSDGDGTSSLAPCVYVAQIGDVKYESLQDALDAAEAADPAYIVVDLLADATLDITARANVLSIGTENTQSITINGNNHTLTFNQKNSDWNDVSTANDAVTRLILNDMNITNSGYNSGHWKRTNLFFNCIVEMNNVTSTALGFKNDATLNNVTIVDNRKDIYGIWIMTNGNNVTINGLNLNTTGDGGRGIAIKDEDSQKIDGTSLEITNATFATEKKGAILVTSPYTVDITASNLDISNVAVDNENAVWVDKKHADKYSYVTLTSSDETMAPEDGESAYVASLVRGEQTRGYYATFAAAYASADYAEGDTYKLHKNTTESVEVAKVLTIVKNGCTAANITAAEGFKKNETEEQITFVTFNPVCEIAGGEQYETLEAAFAAAQDGETITLLADCAGNGIVVPQGKFTTGLTVNFAEFTYTVDGATVGSTGTQTQAFQLLKDNKITFQNGTIYSEKAKILVQNYSNLTLEGMTLTLNNSNYTSAYTLSNNNGSVVIDGSTINANPAGGFAFDVCRYASYLSVSVTVQGESVINGDIEIYASGGNAKDGFGLALNGGTLTGNIVLDATAIAAMEATPEKVSITKADAFEVAAPEGYKWVSDGDGTSSLAPCVYVAQIGTTKYETLEAAFAAAQDGETITLLADCAGNGIVVPQGKFTTGLTVNFGGFTYTVDGATVGSTGTQTQAFQLLKDNKITFQNGTIYSEKAKILVQNYSDLTLEGMTLTLNNSNYTSAYTLSNNNGSVVIDGSTINANPAGGFAFDVCRYASYLSVSVTVQGESVINGNIEISASGNDAKDGFGLTLTAGTFNGNIVLDASAAAAMEATPEKVSITKADAFEVAAPEGYKWVSDGDGTSSLAPCVYVAQIGDVKYETFAEAAEEANGEVITLLANIEDAYTIAVDEILMVKLNGHTLTVNAPAGYTVSSTVADDVTTYSVPMTERDIVLTDGQPYTFNADTQVNSVTYKRKLSDKYTGYYISWYVPFDYTITAEDAENFTFYKISMIANAPEPGEVEESDKIWLYLTRMKAGDILYANRPYVFKAPNAGTTVTYSFTTENATLHARATGSRMNTATAAYNFDFYGTYESTLLEKNLFTYYTNSNGKVSATGDTSITLSSYRWYIKATAKNNYNYAPVFVFTEDDDATGIKLDGNTQAEESYYNLNGMRINKPANGAYIIKYSDGSVKKVAVK